MSPEAIRRMAREVGLPAGTLEKDYAATWLLCGLYDPSSSLKETLVFKGGTAIRKLYFPETWRLSEDLDFTVVGKLPHESVRSGYEAIFEFLSEVSGISYNLSDFNPRPSAIFMNVQYVGPLGGKNRIAHDISLREQLVSDPVRRKVHPVYPDIESFDVKAYSLTEIILEKIRSLFQRARTRDYYDVWRLLKESQFTPDMLGPLLVKKCRINDIPYRPRVVFEERRLEEVKSYWEPVLAHQTKVLPDFEDVIRDLRDGLDFLQD